MLRFTYLLLLCFISLSACNNNYKDPVLKEFKKEKKLKYFPSEISSENIGEVVDIAIMDTILVIHNRFEEFFFKLYNVHNGKIISRKIRHGRGPGELLQPNLIHRYNETLFTTVDVGKKKLMTYSVKEFCTDSSNSISEADLNFGILRAINVCDTLVVCTGIFEDSEFCIQNLNTGLILSKLAYPDMKDQEPISNYTKSFLYQGEIALKPPQKNRLVKVCNGAGLIEICDINENELKNVITKFYFNPVFKLNGMHPVFSQETKFTFHSLNITENFFYVIYSGNSMLEKGGNFSAGHNLLVFDWNGKPLINYLLDREIKRLSIDFNMNVAYAYSVNPISGEPEIICYNIPEER